MISPAKKLSIGRLQLQQIISKYMSSQTSNIRIPLVHPISHKLTDEHIYKYENKMFSAYLKKPKLSRQQIHAKIHIIDDVPQSQQPHLQYQKTFPLKKIVDQQTMKRIVNQDPSQINSSYIISMFIHDDGFKDMIDQYLSKVLVSGKAPSDLLNPQLQVSKSRMLEIEEEVLDLYHAFYFGQQISPLERQIQFYYLAAKQQKYLKRQMFPKNAYYRCIWRPQDQRLLEGIANWTQTDLNLTDLNNRPYFEPLLTAQRLPYVQKLYKLMGGDNILSQLSFQLKVKPNHIYSYAYLNSIVEKLFSRLLIYIKCIQFTHTMGIPPDFSIQLSIIHIHVWLLVDRLKKFNTKQSKNLVKLLQKTHKLEIDTILSSLNLKKIASTQKKYNDSAQLIAKTLDLHFNVYEQSKDNPYFKIDALVWSVVFRQKVERYGQQVYKFSEYLVKNHRHLQRSTEDDFINAEVQFDTFLGDPDYKQNIMSINKPMNKQQFDEQFNSDKEDKQYYYRIDQKQQPIKINAVSPQNDTKYSFLNALMDKSIRFVKKNLVNSKNFDHFSQLDEQEKVRQKQTRKSPWKNEGDKMEEVGRQFQDLQQVRRRRRKGNQNIGQDDKN